MSNQTPHELQTSGVEQVLNLISSTQFDTSMSLNLNASMSFDLSTELDLTEP